MENAELIKALKEDAEWAHANEWETPITLGDHLDAAVNALESLQAQLAESEMQLKVVTNELCNLCHTYADFYGCKTDCLNCDRWRGPQETGKGEAK